MKEWVHPSNLEIGKVYCFCHMQPAENNQSTIQINNEIAMTDMRCDGVDTVHLYQNITEVAIKSVVETVDGYDINDHQVYISKRLLESDKRYGFFKN